MRNDELPSQQWQACERHCRAFESAWNSGAAPAIEDHLPTAENELRDAVLGELVQLDLEFRLRRGMSVRVEEYLRRYPQLYESEHTVLELIEAEFSLRCETEVGLSPTEYAERFPRLAGELESRLSKVRVASFSYPALPDLGDLPFPTVPGCEIIELLGRGGMGIVYKAHHVALDRIVAIKLPHGGAGANEELRNRFQTEARAAALLQHPNIVQIYDVGAANGQPYCLLEYVAGGSLHRKLGEGPLPPRSGAEVLEPLARAIQFAHEHGVIHRDIKPANVLLHSDADGRVVPKITDFGLAKQLDGSQSLTETGVVLGTAQYMAPEQAAGNKASAAADVYSLGAIFYEMLTGRPPLQGAAVLETIQMLMEVDPVPPARLQPKVPRDLETICMKCLQKDPARRYATAAELADDLKRFLVGEAIHARPMGAVERTVRWCRRRPAQALVLALLVLVFVGTTSAAFWYQQHQAKVHADEIFRDADARQKRELATQQITDALAQGRQVRERLRADLVKPGGVFALMNKPVQWEGQILSARAALDRARVVAAGAEGSIDTELLGQIKALDDQLHEDNGLRELAIALETIRLDRSVYTEDGFDLATAEREYPRVFVSAALLQSNDGASTNAATLEQVQRIQESPIREQLLAALDDWAYVAWARRNHAQATNLLQAACLVDPHPWRDEVRTLRAWNSRAVLDKLANQALNDAELFESLSPQMLHLVGWLLMRQEAAFAAPKGKKASVAIGNYKRAESWLRQAQQRHMGDFWLNFQLGGLLKPTQPKEAAGFYRTAIVVRPNSSAAWNNYGVILRAQKLPVDAIRAYRKAVEFEPRNGVALSNLSLTLLDQGEFSEALAICKKQTDAQPRNINAWINLGITHHNLREYAAAKDAFNQALAVDGRSVRAWCNLGRTLRTEENLTDAAQAYEKAIDIEPQSAVAWAGLAGVHLEQKDWKAASRAGKKATEYDPNHAAGWTRLGLAQRELGDVRGAVKSAEKAVELEPDNSHSWTTLGVARRHNKDLPGSIDAHHKAIELNPKNSSAWNNLGYALRDKKDFREAADALRKAVEINDKNSQAWGTLADVLSTLDDPLGAIDAYRKAVWANPRSNAYWNNLGVTLRKQRELVEAGKALEKAISLNSKVVQSHFSLTMVYRDQGAFDKAIKACDRGISSVPLLEGFELAAARLELLALIDQEKRLDKVLAGERKATAIEKASLADLCQRYKNRYCDAFRLYSAAFDEQTELGDSQQRRFEAARAALLCVEGKDAKAPTLDAAECVRRRELALSWLRADLMRIRSGGIDEAASSRELLKRWSSAQEFAPVRDAKKLAMLPASERSAWQQAWADVDKIQTSLGAGNR